MSKFPPNQPEPPTGGFFAFAVALLLFGMFALMVWVSRNIPL